MNIEQIINYYKWEALINFLREKERKKGKNKKLKKSAFARPCVELSPFTLSNTVHQRIKLA